MTLRKIWSEQQDKILKFLKEERGERKWAKIARLMQCQFNIMGRTGKQCRQRYHNHLDSSIINSEWTAEEEEILFKMHEQIGNKWSAISQQLPGRSDNCVKNHFYSKLRKSIRKLNKIISEYFEKDHGHIKERTLSKIIQSQETKFKDSSKVDEQLAQFCYNIKNRLFVFGGDEEFEEEMLEEARGLIVDIEMVEANYKKGYKAILQSEQMQESRNYLKPPKLIKRSNSVMSDKSEDSCLSSSSCVSSCSDLSSFDPIEENKKSKTTASFRNSSGRNSDIMKSERLEEYMNLSKYYYNKVEADVIENEAQSVEFMNAPVVQNEPEMGEMEKQNERLIQEENLQNFQQYFSNMIYDDTPVRARILCPNLLNLDEPNFPLFSRESDPQDYIEFKEERDQ